MWGEGEVSLEGSRTVARTWKPGSKVIWDGVGEKGRDRSGRYLYVRIRGRGSGLCRRVCSLYVLVPKN